MYFKNLSSPQSYAFKVDAPRGTSESIRDLVSLCDESSSDFQSMNARVKNSIAELGDELGAKTALLDALNPFSNPPTLFVNEGHLQTTTGASS